LKPAPRSWPNALAEPARAPEVGLLILAGGDSSRMGADKPGIPFPGPHDPAMIRRGADRLAELAGPPIIAGHHDYGTGWRLVGDEPGITGPVAGLIAGLASADSDWMLVLAADLPFPAPQLAEGLVGIACREPLAQAVVPEREGRLEPLFALYRREAVDELRTLARQSARPGLGPSLRQTVSGLRLRRVSESEWREWDPEAVSFINCNTPGELAAAVERMWSRPDQGGNP
jgi:molybdopterin-guanine dinucleotide biosynthesis protein A